MKRSEIGKLLAMLVAAYPNANVTRETIVVYERMLTDLKADALAEVVFAHIATHKWFPTISEIRRSYFEEQLQIPSAGDAMEFLLEGRPPDIPWVQTLLRSMGGVHSYKHSSQPEHWRKQFCARYEELREQSMRGHLVSRELRGNSWLRLVK